jgi:hypothetical protein
MYIRILFISHGLGWVYVRDEVAWSDKHEDADEQRSGVQGQDDGDV